MLREATRDVTKRLLLRMRPIRGVPANHCGALVHHLIRIDDAEVKRREQLSCAVSVARRCGCEVATCGRAKRSTSCRSGVTTPFEIGMQVLPVAGGLRNAASAKLHCAAHI